MLRMIMLLATALALVAGVTTATAADPQTESAGAAIDYILALQNDDGGFPGFDQGSSAGTTLDAVFALVAAGLDPLEVTNGGGSPADYLASAGPAYAEDPGGAAKLSLGVSAMGLDPRDFGEVDLLAMMEESVDAETGAYGLDMFDEAFYVLAVVAAGEPAPEDVVDHIRTSRVQDGGWEFGPGFGSDSNTTALVLQAMIAGGIGPNEQPVGAAVGYLRSVQHQSGGFGFLPGLDPDGQSTAFVIQGLVAAGLDVGPGGPWERDASPIEALVLYQNPETGAFQFEGVDSPFATFQSVPGVLLAPLPGLESRIILEEQEATPTEAPEATATPASEVVELPPAGAGPSSGGSATWWVALLVLGGAGAAGAAALGRKVR